MLAYSASTAACDPGVAQESTDAATEQRRHALRRQGCQPGKAEGAAAAGHLHVARRVADEAAAVRGRFHNGAALQRADQVHVGALERVHERRQLPAARLGHAVRQLRGRCARARVGVSHLQFPGLGSRLFRVDNMDGRRNKIALVCPERSWEAHRGGESCRELGVAGADTDTGDGGVSVSVCAWAAPSSCARRACQDGVELADVRVTP